MKLYLDCETRSATSIRDGVKNYADDPQFAVILVSWAIDDEPVRLWQPLTEPLPERLGAAAKDADTKFIIHNSAFDRTVLNKSGILGVAIRPEQIIDTMVQALAHCLPGSLGALCSVFRLGEDQAKDKDGRRLIGIFCVPKRGTAEFNDEASHPAEWDRFCAYAISDIVAMREVHKRMPSVNYPVLEHALWCIDQDINDRGIGVDIDLAEAAVREAAIERLRLNAEVLNATSGDVGAATQRDKLIEHLAKTYDIFLPDLKTATLERRLEEPDLPADFRELLEMRLQASQNAAAKYRKVIQCANNSRLNFTMQMYGASRTGRDAGRVFQPQNLKRPTMWHGLEGDELEAAIAEDIESIKTGVVSLVHQDKTMEVLGNCVRSVIVAKPGHKLVQADLSNIEGRGLVWLSNERWKLDYFADFDAGKVKFDNYVMAYAKALNVPPESVTKYNRQIGKVMELGLGYGGGVSAFITFANVYRLDIGELAAAVWETGDVLRLRECQDKHAWAKENGYHAGLNEHQFAACEYLKQLWRESHPQTVAFWQGLEENFKLATNHEGETFALGKLKFKRKGQWLYVRLPSGRCIVYLAPRIEDGSLTFMGVDPFTKKFSRVKTYSGRLAENVTSGTARDVLFHRLPDVESAGYPVVLRVHDELVTEPVDSDRFSHEALAEIMSRPFEWSKGLPLAAAGFETYRYRKD